ncbi:MAG: aldo/keto reductase [Capsulimonadaceae bacterium]
MKYKLLGKSGLRVSELCLGAGTFGTNWGPLGADKPESHRIYNAFVEAGGNFVDTSNRYQEGMSEEIVGECIRSNRDSVIVGSKFSLYDTFAMMNDVNASGNHRKNLVRSVEASLKRLGTDYIDLLWVHMWDYTTPVEEVMRALDDLVRAGKILYIGASNVPSWICSQGNTIAEFQGWTRFNALQVEYSLVERSAEREFLPMAASLDMAVTAWSPLSGGMVTGKYNAESLDPRQTHRLQDPLDPAKHHVWGAGLRRNREIMNGVVALAKEIGRPPVQVALNFIRYQNIIPIFSMRTHAQTIENLGALDWQLTAEQFAMVQEATDAALSTPIVKQGYPNDFLDYGSPAIPGFNVRQMMFGFVGKNIDFGDHRPVKYPGGTEVRPEP